MRFIIWTGVSIGVERGSAFWYPSSAKCLETVERETFTPISSNLVATDPAESEGCLRIYCPIAMDALGVIFLIVLSGIFVKECILVALRVPCLHKCKIVCRWVSCLDGVILIFDNIQFLLMYGTMGSLVLWLQVFYPFYLFDFLDEVKKVQHQQGTCPNSDFVSNMYYEFNLQYITNNSAATDIIAAAAIVEVKVVVIVIGVDG
ncbi:hypothetical protein C1645_742113 [Glomus cerebriforme]|uniref:Uncharacterized protein n=1 Tax=Glomus cerebriforme TaxID=658196 RepID=A0A397SKV3_9GLOM|nr:hypothetical protein C1645_742113 [Glomus cerebriforme]